MVGSTAVFTEMMENVGASDKEEGRCGRRQVREVGDFISVLLSVGMSQGGRATIANPFDDWGRWPVVGILIMRCKSQSCVVGAHETKNEEVRPTIISQYRLGRQDKLSRCSNEIKNCGAEVLAEEVRRGRPYVQGWLTDPKSGVQLIF